MRPVSGGASASRIVGTVFVGTVFVDTAFVGTV